MKGAPRRRTGGGWGRAVRRRNARRRPKGIEPDGGPTNTSEEETAVEAQEGEPDTAAAQDKAGNELVTGVPAYDPRGRGRGHANPGRLYG